MRSTMPASSRSSERTRCCVASSGARSGVRCRIAEAPSGGSGESHECWAHTTRSAGMSASAPPPVPCPSSTHTVGTGSTTSSARQRAISPAMPPSSASFDSAAPAVSMTLTSGSPSSVASFMPRRATRRPEGPSGASARSARRSCPRTTHGIPPKRASARKRLRSHSPAPVPNSGSTSVAPSLSRARTPGRSGSRERVTDSHAGRSGSGSRGTAGTGSVSCGASTRSRNRPAIGGSASTGSTASSSPCSYRFSAVCTSAGNGSP